MKATIGDKMGKILLAILMIATVVLNNCFAADFYCGKYIVAIGDTTYDVSMKCEKSKCTDNIEYEVVQEIAPGEWKLVHVNKEIWVYNWGPNRFMTKLVFLNDKLHKIKDLGYGYLEKDIGSFGNNENKLYTKVSQMLFASG